MEESNTNSNNVDSNIINEEEVLYLCLECRGVWDDSGVDVFETKDIKKYICKECRGTCLPKKGLDKKTGVKSLKQNFNKSNVSVYIVLGILAYLTYLSYASIATISDYKTYLADNADLRKKINSQLVTFKKDYMIIKSNLAKEDEITDAQKRITDTKRYIRSLGVNIEKMRKPEKNEIQKLYDLETKFWKDPNYENYLSYSSVFDDLKAKYGLELFENVRSNLRKRLENMQKKRIANR
ncbi:MAG: hypothetical protein AABZ74_09480 [Cyanobacteriota bacterium]